MTPGGHAGTNGTLVREPKPRRMTPTQRVFAFVERHPLTLSSITLAMSLLAFWNVTDWPFVLILTACLFLITSPGLLARHMERKPGVRRNASYRPRRGA